MHVVQLLFVLQVHGTLWGRLVPTFALSNPPERALAHAQYGDGARQGDTVKCAAAIPHTDAP